MLLYNVECMNIHKYACVMLTIDALVNDDEYAQYTHTVKTFYSDVCEDLNILLS